MSDKDTGLSAGHVVVVMGPTGSGKGTIIKGVLGRCPGLHQSVSCTTRAPRPGEVEGVDYYFISEADFQAKIKAGEFLEWASFSGNHYGTLKSEVVSRLKADETVLLEVEAQGVEQLRKLVPSRSLLVVYVESGGWEVLKARAQARAPMNEAELNLRYERYLIERDYRDKADVVINNEDAKVEHAVDHLVQVIKEL